jgi:TatD DNase family protein
MLVDSHCHLDYLARAGILEGALARAREAGVGAMLTICTSVEAFPEVLAIAERHDNLWCSVGVHPHSAAGEVDVTAEQLVELSRHPKVIGIGECGLDYFYERSPRLEQQTVFRTHIEAARAAGLPLIVHSRDADQDTVDLLAAGAAKGGLRGLIHCFSTTRYLSDNALNIGFYISLSGILTFPKSEGLREIAAELPPERILVETDSPYLAPVPHRGQKCEPAHVAATAACLAELKGMTPELLAATTTANFFRLFDKARPVPRAGAAA